MGSSETRHPLRSLPSRERGLKFIQRHTCGHNSCVAPFTGAWIEIAGVMARVRLNRVAPFTGAWIEITGLATLRPVPSVAPFTGAWIEIGEQTLLCAYSRRRSLHGSVD